MSNNIILAAGADIKNRFLLAKGNSLRFGPEIGDLSIAENYEIFKKQIRGIFKKFKPDVIAYDLHPGYFSSNFLSTIDHRPSTIDYRLPVQHHHAHIASVICEHNIKTPVIGVCFDGTGYGSDGNIWGGEFLQVDKKGFKRLAHLKYRMMPGGEKVVRQPWRMALSILGKRALPFLKDISGKDKKTVLLMMQKNINCPISSSAGRLFDAAAALLGICQIASYEAQGPVKLQALCDDNEKAGYACAVKKQGSCYVIDTDGMFSGAIKDLKRKVSKAIIAARFHNSFVEIIVKTSQRLSKDLNIKTIALSGGVFQNQFLKTKAIDKLKRLGFKVFTNNNTRVNDLNISLGQYYVSCNSCEN